MVVIIRGFGEEVASLAAWVERGPAVFPGNFQNVVLHIFGCPLMHTFVAAVNAHDVLDFFDAQCGLRNHLPRFFLGQRPLTSRTQVLRARLLAALVVDIGVTCELVLALLAVLKGFPLVRRMEGSHGLAVAGKSDLGLICYLINVWQPDLGRILLISRT